MTATNDYKFGIYFHFKTKKKSFCLVQLNACIFVVVTAGGPK